MKSPVIDRSAKTITVTKDFLIHAGQFGTPEFKIISEMKQRHPGFTVEVRTIARNPEKRTYGNLTYDVMEDFIKGHESDNTKKDVLKEFMAVRKVAKTMRGSYALVKKWFLERYEAEFQTFQNELDAQKLEKNKSLENDDD